MTRPHISLIGKKGTDGGGGPTDVKSADSREECSTAGTRSMTL
jgi:hypothetical protein